MGLVWVGMGVWWRGVERLGSCILGVLSFFCVCFDWMISFLVVWMFLFRCGNDRRQSDTDTFPAFLLLL